MSQSRSITDEYARLFFSTNSLRNTSIQCDALGLYYQLSTPMDGMIKNERTITITRWDPRVGEDAIIAEWQQKELGSDRVRLDFHRQLIVEGSQSADGFISVDQFFPSTSGVPGWQKRTFTANNGRRYTWRCSEFSLKLFEEDLETDIPIAEYGESNLFINKRNAYISITRGCEEILDYLVVTCAIAERKRRAAKKITRRSTFYMSAFHIATVKCALSISNAIR